MRSGRLWCAGWASLIAVASCAPTPPLPAPVNSATHARAEQKPATVVTPTETPQSERKDEKAAVEEDRSAKRQAKSVVVEYEPAPESNDTFTLEDDFVALSLNDFDAFQAESDTWTATDDGIQSTGKPRGYLYSKDSYQNFTWRLEYRFERPKDLQDDAKFKGNTGFMIYISGDHTIWPVSLEVQGKHAEMAAIKANGGASPVTSQDNDAARHAARQPVGRWNRLEIISRDGALTATLNDQPISRSEPNFLSVGQIGLQAEGHPFAVRRMRIRRD